MKSDYSIIIKYLFNDLTESELNNLIEWRKESTSNEAFFDSVMNLKLNYNYKNIKNSEQTARALKNINRHLNRNRTLSVFKEVIKYVAIFLFMFSVTHFIQKNIFSTHSYIRITVERGEDIKKLNLADGTVVWLNEASTLEIPKSFSLQKRFVKLSGEAYFDVKKNQSSPFVVDATSMKIKVVGTSFSLKSRKEESIVETILVSGKVVILDNDEKPVYDMSPGEKVIYTPTNNEYVVKTIDTNVSTAWHLDQLTFENSTLREIVNKLSLIYDVNINLESKQLADRKYRCVINRDETLQQVLNILLYLAPIKYKIEDDEVFIYE